MSTHCSGCGEPLSVFLRCSRGGGHLALAAWTGAPAGGLTDACGRRGRRAGQSRAQRCGWRRVRSAASGEGPRRLRGAGRTHCGRG